MKGFGDYKNSKNKSSKDSVTQNLKKQLISQAIELHLKGNIPEATKYYQDLIKKGFNDHTVLLNYGVILKNHGKLKEAEIFFRKAIEFKPNYAWAYSNLANFH